MKKHKAKTKKKRRLNSETPKEESRHGHRPQQGEARLAATRPKGSKLSRRRGALFNPLLGPIGNILPQQ